VVIFQHDPLGASGIEDLNHLESAMPQITRQTGLTGAKISYARDTALAADTPVRPRRCSCSARAEAIAIAAPEASRAIRASGITLAASFAIIAIIPIRSFREIAFAMATGILIETFVVRSLLAPS
jgi:hypothetical protein